MSTAVATVAVVSPQPVVVDGFVTMLGRHPDRARVIHLPRTFDDEEPDVVLYDVLGLLDADGSDLDALVKKTASVVFAVGRELRPDLLGQALSRGADGFFQLGASEDDVLAAVDSAMTGWEAGDPGPDPVIGSDPSEQRARRLGHDVGLTGREARMLSLIAQGLSNDEVAARDFLSVNTVKTYIRSAYRKIGVANRTQAAIWAVQHGFSPHEDASTFGGPDPAR